MNMKISALIVSASLLLSACSALPPAPEQPVSFTVLHTNDHHGRFWRGRHGEYGLAARKTLIDAIRAEVAAAGGHVLLFSGGDVNTGVPESDLQDAEPDFKAMNLLGYDAMAVGNHEFDNPLEVLLQQQEWSDFDFLSANVYYEANQSRIFAPHKFFDVGGLRLALLGLTTEDTKAVGNPEFLGGIEFRTGIEEAAELVPDLRRRAHVVLALTHMGHYADAQHGINAPADVSLARQVEGIDAIIGGHSHDAVCMAAENVANTDYQPGEPCTPDRQNGTWIMQAHEWGRYLGRADFRYAGGELELLSYKLIPVNLKRKVDDERVFVQAEIAEDPQVLALLEPYQERGQQALGQVIGSTDGDLIGERGIVRFEPTNLGMIIADAQREKMQADLAVMNSGGIRASIVAGDISYKDILTVQPFANAVTYVDLSGAELLEYLAAAAAKPTDSGAFAQFSSNVAMTIVGGAIESVQVDGEAIDPATTYRLAINSYLASGGDKYPAMNEHPGYVNSRFVDADALVEFIRKRGSLQSAQWADSQIIRR